MSIGSLTLDFLHSRYKCTMVLLTKISPVAALPINPKTSTLMKASFQLADLFVFVELRSPVKPGMTPSTGKTMLFPDAVNKWLR